MAPPGSPGRRYSPDANSGCPDAASSVDLLAVPAAATAQSDGRPPHPGPCSRKPKSCDPDHLPPRSIRGRTSNARFPTGPVHCGQNRPLPLHRPDMRRVHFRPPATVPQPQAGHRAAVVTGLAHFPPERHVAVGAADQPLDHRALERGGTFVDLVGHRFVAPDFDPFQIDRQPGPDNRGTSLVMREGKHRGRGNATLLVRLRLLVADPGLAPARRDEVHRRAIPAT
jgi:hypothetical protein